MCDFLTLRLKLTAKANMPDSVPQSCCFRMNGNGAGRYGAAKGSNVTMKYLLAAP